jgi:diaminohydroxyphosphoribosylaminopyrimidine deaminase/5-amino-6-(5-phosphoribosylamino)uracil reductase
LGAKVLTGEGAIIATLQGVDPKRIQSYRQHHVRVWELPPDDRGNVELAALLRRAGQEEVTSVLIEGGRQVYTSALRAGLVDRMLIFVAPKLLGEGLESVGDLAIMRMEDALQMQQLKVRRIGPDVLISGRL